MLWVSDYTIKEDSRQSRRNFGGLSGMAPSFNFDIIKLMFFFTENYMIQLTAGGLTGASGACVHDPVVEEHRRAHGPNPPPDPEGEPCHREASQTQTCNLETCPG